MRYDLIDDPLCEVDDEIPAYENCEECPYFYDCMEVEEEMNTFEEIKTRLDDLSDDELKNLAATANTITESRRLSHKKELWKNVIRAIQDYTEAFGDITVGDEKHLQDDLSCRTPGYFYIDC